MGSSLDLLGSIPESGWAGTLFPINGLQDYGGERPPRPRRLALHRRISVGAPADAAAPPTLPRPGDPAERPVVADLRRPAWGPHPRRRARLRRAPGGRRRGRGRSPPDDPRRGPRRRDRAAAG